MKTSYSSRKAENLEALAERRVEAGKLFDQGWRQAQVAREFGVSPQTASRWYQMWREGGRQRLGAWGRAGRPCRLTDEQLGQLREELVRGPEAQGYQTNLWTLQRIARLIRQRFGVQYSLTQVWRVLRKLGFSCQKPARRARQRNEEEIEEWRRKEWPRIKRGHSGGEPR